MVNIKDGELINGTTIKFTATNTSDKLGDGTPLNLKGATIVNLVGPFASIDRASLINNKALTSINIPATVTSIDDLIFFSTSLTSVTFDEPSSLKTIGYQAFYGTTNLKSITIPKSVTLIDYKAFQNSGLTTIIFDEPSSLTTIGDYAFYNTGIRLKDIPTSVTSIGSNAFSKDIQTIQKPTLTTGQIIGISIGVTVLGGGIIAAIVIEVNKKKKKNDK